MPFYANKLAALEEVLLAVRATLFSLAESESAKDEEVKEALDRAARVEREVRTANPSFLCCCTCTYTTHVASNLGASPAYPGLISRASGEPIHTQALDTAVAAT